MLKSSLRNLSAFFSHQQGYGSLNSQKFSVRNLPYSRSTGNRNVNDDYDEEDEEDLGGEEKNHDQNNGVRCVGKNMDDEDNEDDEDDDDDEDGDTPKVYNENNNDVDLERHPKKRKLKNLVSSYEFAPRHPCIPVPAPAAAAPLLSVPKPSHGGRNSLTDWTECETFILLDAWGDSFLQRWRKSLRSEEWKEVAEKVSERLVPTSSKWVYFRKMDMLMSTPPQQGGLACGLDSGESVFVNPRVCSSCANGMDEMRDSPANSESADSDEDISDGLPPKKRRFGRQYDEGKNDFHRELEMQKRQIMESARAEIAKIQHGDEEDNDVSATNASRRGHKTNVPE
ncbi:putative pentatricopeptide repeat-containing protein [Hibiscus syriacus]|uniref:Pentatricopeptide repeat-containing protein n=1 Tax=Hibiscus syriacus TaxID=106335 RepID=A0A6A3A8M8_HIBSY|nr:putative pentatricopeptide repeat-containing protein [Hibiscus syriacus]